MNATIWHNPRCSKSRETLAILDAQGACVTVIDYLRHPPTVETLARLYAIAGMTPRDGLRQAEQEARSLQDADGATILEAMAINPMLIERPLVETDRGVRLCRPPELVLDIL